MEMGIFDLHRPKGEYSLIRFRFPVGGKWIAYYLPKEYKVKPTHWDHEAKCAICDARRNGDIKGDPRLKTHLNNVNTEIISTRNTLIDILQEYQRKKIKPVPVEVRAQLSERMGKRVLTAQNPFFLDFVEDYISNNVDLQEQTKKQQESAKNVIERYSKVINKKLRFEDITVDFRNDFVKYLKTTKHEKGDYYKPNTIARIFKNIKTWMGAAYDKGLTSNNDFKKKAFGVQKEEVDTVYLKAPEIEQMYNTDLSGSPRLEKIRDVFIIMCCTGVRYSDYLLLKKENILPLWTYPDHHEEN